MSNQFQRYRQVIACLSPPIQAIFTEHEAKLASVLREIRLRANRPLSVITDAGSFFFTQSGTLTSLCTNSLFCAMSEDLLHTLQAICDYSLYNRQQEIASGYVTLKGGHRAGICGTAVFNGGVINNIRDLSSVNLRVAGEFIGCADVLLMHAGDLSNGLLICGAPCSGKTTLLRDLARQLSCWSSVSLIDERGEIAACVRGVPQNDVGLCDVYSGYPKCQAMEQAIRTMSPDYIICDELGERDIHALEDCARCGTAVIATVHARDSDELLHRNSLRQLLLTNAFQKVVFLAGREQVGRVKVCVSVGDVLAA